MGFSSSLSGGAEPEPGQEGQNNNFMMRPVEGSLLFADKINQAYTRALFNDTYSYAGMQFMPFKPRVRAEAEKAINCVGDIVYPMLTSLGLPIFMYNIVLEKELKLV